MEACLRETERRRTKQLEHNIKNNVESKSTTGSNMLSIFDLLKDEIATEKDVAVENSTGSEKRKSRVPPTRGKGRGREGLRSELSLGSIRMIIDRSNPLFSLKAPTTIGTRARRSTERAVKAISTILISTRSPHPPTTVFQTRKREAAPLFQISRSI